VPHIFLNLPGSTPVAPVPDIYVVFPYSAFRMNITLGMYLNLPIGTRFIIWHNTDNVYFDRIEVWNGLKSFTIQRVSQDALLQ
jgi:hypothetical protein